MNIGPRIGQYQNLSQKLVMTAMLQQAIKLLPLTRQELILKIRQEMVENPFLDDVQAEEDGYDIESERENGNTESSSASTESDSSEPEIDLTSYFDSDLDMGYHEADRSEFPSLENRLRKETTLTDHLLWQFSLAEVPERLKPVGVQIIGNLSDDGYFRAEVEDIVLGTDSTPDDVDRALEIIQTFDPPGIAARNLKECLLLQVQSLGIFDPLLDEILENHLEQLEDRFLPKVARSLGVEVSEVVEVAQLIRSLNPQPGLLFNETRSEYVYPDVYVLKTGVDPGEEYQIFLNEDGMPRLRINSTYRALLREKSAGDGPAVPERPAPVRPVAHQEHRATAPDPDEGLPEHRPVPAGFSRSRDTIPPALGPSGRGPGHRHARIHRQPCHDRQVHAHAPGYFRVEVLLSQ